MRARLRFRSEDGQSLVEFGVAVPLLCFIVLALVDFGRAVNYWLNATHLASQGARLAAVWGPNQSDSSCTALANKIKASSYTTDTVHISFPAGTAAIGDPVRVTVEHPYSWAPSGIIKTSDWDITGSATMRLEQQPTFTGGCDST